ncbi:MAG TPA: flotillin family protein, partial [Clostridia bacterium]|nr:flotillin family protein [Clostridia bacterium]
NKNRQIIVARKNKERTEAIEIERVEKDRQLEVTERERIVTLANIEKTKILENEQKAIQNVIRERFIAEKAAVEERERVKDTEAFAEASRQKKVLVTKAEMEAEQSLIKNIKAAEAAKRAAELKAEQDVFITVKAAEGAKEAAELKAQEVIIEAEATQSAATKQAAAKKALAEAQTSETAAVGLAEAEVMEAKAEALEKQGLAEAKVMELKFQSEAKGITEKAEAMKLLDGVGREHEEFKLRLNKEKEVELAHIAVQKGIAESQALVISEALKSAKIEIVGGEAQFFDKITSAVTAGRSVDHLVQNSKALTDIKETFFNSDPDYFFAQMKTWVDKFGLTSNDLKNLTVAAALSQMMTLADDSKIKGVLTSLLSQAQRAGLSDKLIGSLLGKDGQPVTSN